MINNATDNGASMKLIHKLKGRLFAETLQNPIEIKGFYVKFMLGDFSGDNARMSKLTHQTSTKMICNNCNVIFNDSTFIFSSIKF